MRRILLLYIDNEEQRFAEGLIHVDGSVYVRGFYPIQGEPFKSLKQLHSHMTNQFESFFILEVDK